MPLGTASGGQDEFNSIVPLSNGQLLVGGDSTGPDNGTATPPTTLVVARINPDLSLDTGFANGGVYRSAPSVTSLVGGILAVASDGAIVSIVGPSVVRLTPDGQPDPTFGTTASPPRWGRTAP